MNRELSICPQCAQEVEWYNDHLTPRNMDYRCGNCFEGITEEQLEALKANHAEIVQLRQKYEDALHAIRRLGK